MSNYTFTFLEHLQSALETERFAIDDEPSNEQLREWKNDFQLELLNETVKCSCAFIPYYRKRIAHYLSPLGSLDELSHYPILTKLDIFNNRRDFVNPNAKISSYRCTTGTTGSRLPIPVSHEEVEAINQFGRVRALASDAASDKPFLLRVLPPVRRLVADPGGRGNGPIITTFLNLDSADIRFDFDYYDHIIQCLTEKFAALHGPEQVNVLWSTPPFMLKLITEGLLQRSFDPRDSQVRNLVTSGGIVTSSLTDYIKYHWNATLSTYYSMAEIAGAHPKCNASGMYHFDLYAIPEFLDPDSRQPVSENEEGVLTFTSLMPFQIATPLIRYWTNDVFTVKKGKCICGFDGTSGIFHGRLPECVNLRDVLPAGVKPRIVGTADFLEVLDRFPQVANMQKGPKYMISGPIDTDRRLHFTVETYSLPDEQRDGLRYQIARALNSIFVNCDIYNHTSTLSGALDLIDVTLARKGDIRRRWGYYPDR